jgi:hypothetical protein
MAAMSLFFDPLQTLALLDIITSAGGISGVFILLIAFLGLAILANQTSAVTPAAVGRMIDRYGAKRTVDKLSNATPNDIHTDFGDFDKVLDGIASGDGQWLALVPRLAPGTDAGTAESLPVVVAEALPKNPAGVLRLVKRDAAWLGACGYPMIEPTRKEMRAYFKAAIPAVKSVHDPTLRTVKRLCLTELLKARRGP